MLVIPSVGSGTYSPGPNHMVVPPHSSSLSSQKRLEPQYKRDRPTRLHRFQNPRYSLEKALTFLDDTLLPATSNAVERGNRRHRKMQKSVYRVRGKACLEGRIALDMLRESRAEGREQTTETLHKTRRGYT